MIYNIAVFSHNIWRWVVIFMAIWALYRAYAGLIQKREWVAEDGQAGRYFTIALDLQILVGLILYFILSPVTRSAMANFGAAMSDANLRFFAVEHILWMVVALILAHIGTARVKRVPDSSGKFRSAVIWYTLAVLAILLGMPWGRPLIPGI